MKDLVKYLSIGLLAVTLAACQQTDSSSSSGKTVKVGILQYVEHESLTAARQGFETELEQQGYTIEWDYQNAQGDQSQLQTVSERLVADSDLVLGIATPAAQSLALASTETPILFTAVTDPASADLVESLEKPGGLLTGTSDQAPIGKQVELIKQALPSAKKVGILYTTNESNSEVQVKQAEAALKAAGYTVDKKGISSTNDVQDAASSLMSTVDVVFVPTDNTIASTMVLLGQLSIEKKVPIVGGSIDMVKVGGLLTYGTDYQKLGAQTARQAVKILSGEQPARLSVELPEHLELYVNQDMADKLDLDLSALTTN
ncbi:ABC transporter substrate binding protein [Streptococcus sp. E29BA]|uniref:ABC transporter substrate binding protein n=1 Tax=Streptococcus sp. E29BA TaxID=3278716 RepID=UPI00359CDAB5